MVKNLSLFIIFALVNIHMFSLIALRRLLMKTSETCTFAICLDEFFVSNFIFVHISTVCYLNIRSPVFFNGLDDTVNSFKITLDNLE